MGVLAHRREQPRALPLELHPEQVDHVAARQHGVEVVGHLDPQRGDLARHEGGGAADDDLRAELHEAVDVAARDAAVGDVADERDRQPGHRAAVLADREDVEQALRGVLVRPVAGVDDTDPRRQVLRQQLRSAGRRVPHDDGVDAHRLDVAGGVGERLALRGTRPRRREVERLRAQPAAGEAEADLGTRRVLEEQVRHDLAGERAQLRRLAADAEVARGVVEQPGDLRGREFREGEQVLHSLPLRCEPRPGRAGGVRPPRIYRGGPGPASGP